MLRTSETDLARSGIRADSISNKPMAFSHFSASFSLFSPSAPPRLRDFSFRFISPSASLGLCGFTFLPFLPCFGFAYIRGPEGRKCMKGDGFEKNPNFS